MPKVKLVTDRLNSYFTNNKITVGASAPTTGTYTSGDMVVSSSPNSVAFGWICTASGTPGSWKILKSADDVVSLSWNNITGKPSTYAPTIGTTSTTAFRGDLGNTAYNHSQSAHAPSNAQKNSDITKAEIEAKLTGNITTHTHDYAAVSHGTHVPTPQTANNAVFLRNDNTWQTITASAIGAGVSYDIPPYGEGGSFVKIAEFNDAGSGNVHGEAIISGSGNFGYTGHMVGILRVSGRGDRRVQLIKLTDADNGGVEIGYTRSGTTTTVWLGRPSYDGGGKLLPLSSSGVNFISNMVSQGNQPEGYTTGSNIMSYQYLKVSPTIANNLSLKGKSTGGQNYDLIGVDAANNIFLGWDNQTYIDVNNTTRFHRDIHMQAGANLYAPHIRISNGQWSNLGFGPTNVRLEYNLNDCVYVAGSETQGGGYGTPFRAKHFQNVNNYMKFGEHWLTVGTSATPSAVGDVWIQV